MILDDETLLSAYLDGELDPDERFRVEAAFLADPELADRLRQLAAVHDLLAGLPRPALAGDLSRSVVSAAGHRQADAPATPARLLRHPRMRMLVEGSMAATVLLAGTLGVRTALRNVPPRPDLGPRIARVPAAPVAPAVGRPIEVTARELPAPAGSPAPETPKNPASRPPVAPRTDLVEVDREQERERVRALLDSPDLTRIFVITDEIGGHAREDVAKLVDSSPRLDAPYGRITVGQGILIDPDHPGEATVFALAMDDRELERFRSKLQVSFPDAVEETRPDPTVVTQLADIGQVAVFPGTTTSRLVSPPQSIPNRLAIRSEARRKHSEKAHATDEFPGMEVVEVHEVAGQDGPTPQQERSGPHPSTRHLKDQEKIAHAPRGEGAGGSDEPGRVRRPSSIVLVWVTTRGGLDARHR